MLGGGLHKRIIFVGFLRKDKWTYAGTIEIPAHRAVEYFALDGEEDGRVV